MHIELFIGIMAGLLVTYLIIGCLVAKKVTSASDYLLAGKSLSIPAVTATLLAAQVGGGMFLGTAQNPLHGLLYILGIVLGLLVLGLGFAEKMRHLNVSSIGEIFEKTYESVGLHHLASALCILSFLGILIGQILAIKSILLASAGISSILLLSGFWMTIVAYTMIGGFHAAIITDFFRIIFIVLVFSGICIYSLIATKFSFFSATSFGNVKTIFSQANLSWPQALRLVLIPAGFCLVEQDLAQKLFSARTPRIAGLAALYASGLLLLFAFVPFYFGIEGQSLGLDVMKGENPLIPILTSLTNTFFFTIAICGVLSAITSTTDSLLCATSSIVSGSVASFFGRSESSILFSRFVIFITGIATLIASYFFSESIIDVLVDSYEIALSALFVPFVFALSIRDFRKKAAWSAALTGLFMFFLCKQTSLLLITHYWPSTHSLLIFCHTHASTLTFSLSTAAYVIGFIYSEKKAQQAR